jgi:hypothetical protein
MHVFAYVGILLHVRHSVWGLLQCVSTVAMCQHCCNVSALLQCVAVYYPFCRTSLLGLRDRKMSVCLSVCPCLSSPRLYPKGSICEGLVSCSDLHFHLAPRRTFLCGVYLSNHANDKSRVVTLTVSQADICIVSVCHIYCLSVCMYVWFSVRLLVSRICALCVCLSICLSASGSSSIFEWRIHTTIPPMHM